MKGRKKQNQKKNELMKRRKMPEEYFQIKRIKKKLKTNINNIENSNWRVEDVWKIMTQTENGVEYDGEVWEE